MGTMVLTSHDCLKNRLPEDPFTSSPPEKSGRDANRRRESGTSFHQNKLSNRGDVPRSPPSQTKPSRSQKVNCNRGGHVTPVRPGRRGRMAEGPGPMVEKVPVKKLVMGEVTILKRGEDVKLPTSVGDPRREEENVVPGGGEDPDLSSTGRLGPDPEVLPKQIRITDPKPNLYAGSGFFTSSPPPSSLPLPTSFFKKKDVVNTTDLTTRGLRCLLRLDLP